MLHASRISISLSQLQNPLSRTCVPACLSYSNPRPIPVPPQRQCSLFWRAEGLTLRANFFLPFYRNVRIRETESKPAQSPKLWAALMQRPENCLRRFMVRLLARSTWVVDYNNVHPHFSLDYKITAAFAARLRATGHRAVLLDGSALTPVAQPAPKGVSTVEAPIATG